MIESLLKAILDDDEEKVGGLIKRDPALVSSPVETPRLYESKIYHWIYSGDTALHLAAAGYRTKIVATLLKAGADANASKNHRRSRPLHYAADGTPDIPNWDARRQVKTLNLLLDAGAQIDAQDLNGATPLHRAVRTRCAAAAHFLLQSGCDPLIRNKSGSMPFHLAVQTTGRGGSGEEKAKRAQREIIEEFMNAGISPALKDGKGKTVMDCARSPWIRELLIGSGA
jgi:ankyrin repeat protein